MSIEQLLLLVVEDIEPSALTLTLTVSACAEVDDLLEDKVAHLFGLVCGLAGSSVDIYYGVRR
jgi:hypothetical protein